MNFHSGGFSNSPHPIQNGIRDPGEKGMTGWKVCIDTNNNNTYEENSEAFNLSNNNGYYEFDSLKTGTYSILETLKNSTAFFLWSFLIFISIFIYSHIFTCFLGVFLL